MARLEPAMALWCVVRQGSEMSQGPDLSKLRERFPSLSLTLGGRPCVFADAPGGTQVPDEVVQAMARYLRSTNANEGGAFVTSQETDELIGEARVAGADLVGGDPGEVVFGTNMTTLNFALSRSLARHLGPGDEVVVTVLDHDANVAPWLSTARERGAEVRWVDVDSADCTLDLTSLDTALGPRTRIVAFTLASNSVGTITAAREVVARSRAVGAIVVADAVHYAQHRAIDVRSLGVDVLFCSAYKFFGPHLGLMWARRDHLDAWEPYKVRPAPDKAPERWETGTLNHEGLAGLVAAVGYLADVGRIFGNPPKGDRRSAVVAGMKAIRAYEGRLGERFLEAVSELPEVRLYGISEVERANERTPTFAVRVGGRHPREVAAELGRRGIFVWDGNYYALAIMERLGLEATGGAVRVGFCHYATAEEVDRVIDELRDLSG
jgi:cysteine desulfurase family protein (TIGR01976 family)